MANAAKLSRNTPARVLIVGYPGSGKTGSLVPLVEAGLKLRVLAYDKEGNMQTLVNLVVNGAHPEMLENVDIVQLEDKMRMGAKVVETSGIPDAFARGFKLLDRWKYTDTDGTEVDLGASKDWGPDTVVVLDTLSAQGEAALRRARSLNNATLLTTSDRVFGLAMAEQEAFIEKLVASGNRHHTIVLTHLRIISPRDLRKGEEDLTAHLKEEVAKLVPTRLYPNALGWKLPQEIGKHFPVILEAKRKIKGTHVSHVLKTVTDLDLDLRIPALNVPAEMDTSVALVKVFDAVSPMWRDAVKSGGGSPSL